MISIVIVIAYSNSNRIQQPTTYPHPRIPAARLFFVFLCFLLPRGIRKSGVGISCWVPKTNNTHTSKHSNSNSI